MANAFGTTPPIATQGIASLGLAGVAETSVADFSATTPEIDPALLFAGTDADVFAAGLGADAPPAFDARRFATDVETYRAMADDSGADPASGSSSGAPPPAGNGGDDDGSGKKTRLAGLIGDPFAGLNPQDWSAPADAVAELYDCGLLGGEATTFFISQLCPHLQEADPENRAQVCNLIAAIAQEAGKRGEKLPVLLELVESLGDLDAKVSQAASVALGKMVYDASSATKALEILTGLSESHRVHARAHVALELGSIAAVLGFETVWPTFRQLLADSSPEVHQRAVRGIARAAVKGANVEPAITSLLHRLAASPTPSDIEAAGVIGLPLQDAVPLLIKIIEEASTSRSIGSDRTIVAISALSRIGASPAPFFSALVDILKHGDPDEREAAALFIKDLGPISEEAMKPLIEAFQYAGENIALPRAAEAALAMYGPSAAILYLEAFRHSTTTALRAAKLLQALQGKIDDRFLAEMIERTESMLRELRRS